MGNRHRPSGSILQRIQEGVSRRRFLRAGLGVGSGTVMATVVSACGGGGGTGSTGSSLPPPPLAAGPGVGLGSSNTGAGSSGQQGSDTPSSPVVASGPVRFDHGVASGDPTRDSVILWTRITPQQATDLPFAVTVEVFDNPTATLLVSSRRVETTAARDYTVKFDQTGLLPGRFYWYRFSCNGAQSLLGRTKTAPVTASELKFGLASCSSLPHGFFNAYRFMAARDDLDAVIHLGDYLYEYGNGEYGNLRTVEPPTEMITLSDYRTRHGFYKKADPDLQLLHSRLPFITIWDDHESTNDSFKDGAENHTQGTEGVWQQRKAWAQQAYDEWMPIRLPEAGNPAKIWRRLRYGDLADLFMLDTRLWARDQQAGTPVNPLPVPGQVNASATDRKLIGDDQMAFLKDGLQSSTARWKIIGNQVVFHQWVLKPGTELTATLTATLGPLSGLQNLVSPTGLNGDSWDGYTAERTSLIEFLERNRISNTVFLTGDVHSSWVADITRDPNLPLNLLGGYNPLTGAGSVATEFVVTSVTSPGLPLPDQVIQAFRVTNPHIKYINVTRRGYSVLTLNDQRAKCDYWYVSSIETRDGVTEELAASFETASGSNRISGALSSLPSLPDISNLPVVGSLI